MSHDSLELTAYFGERDRVGRRFLADALIDLYARRGIRTSLVLRGVEGFGVHHHVHSARLLSLSEDLPVVAVAVDRAERVEPLVGEVAALASKGLITVERARMVDGAGAEALADTDAEAKLTVYVGRQERLRGRPAYVEVVALLQRCGVAGATVLLGVDGTAAGVRERARFFARNAEVPMMIVSVGDRDAVGRAVAELAALERAPLMTLERVRVLRRDGRRLAGPQVGPWRDEAGRAIWLKLTLYAGEHARGGGTGGPLYLALVRRLRSQGAAGATALRGVWGYSGDHPPHGDSFWRLGRRVPTVTTVIDTPERALRWLAVAEELTARTGLVTSEIVPAMRATAPGIARGGLRLARLVD